MRDLLNAIRQAIRSGSYGFTRHALWRMEQRGISRQDLESVVLAETAEIIEDYPDDQRGASCLILGWDETGRVLHVQ
jgi:hypothetical protein